jgi:Tol biopolymer transport system component
MGGKPPTQPFAFEYRALPLLPAGARIGPINPTDNDRGTFVPETFNTPESPTRLEDRLDSWKEIAAYLNRDVTTAQRWEKREGMPVHRHLHDKFPSVYAFRTELDAWVRGRNANALPGHENNTSAPSPTAPKADSQTTARLSHKLWLVVLFTVAGVVFLAGVVVWLQGKDYFWRNPIAGAHFRRVTDWDGAAQAAALSRDGQFLAFLSDRDGQIDVWITQVGSGQFHNLTQGKEPELVNPSIRPLGFSPEGSLVTFWVRKKDDLGKPSIGIWAVPILGGLPRPYLEGAAELDWSSDGARVVFHTTDPGDPLFVSSATSAPKDRPIFSAPSGLHCHFPAWAPDSAFIYFAEGTPPDNLNIWRIRPDGRGPEQITSQAGVSNPVLLNRRTLLYLAADADGSGPWLYSMDVAHRLSHRLSFGLDRYTSLSADAGGHRLAATLATPKTTLWRTRVPDTPSAASLPTRIELTTSAGRSPRLGSNYLLYVSQSETGESIWKLDHGASEELWHGSGAQVTGIPAISPDGRHIAFSVLQSGQKLLYVMGPDGSNARVVSDSLDLQGSPSWTPDGEWITSAVNEQGVPHLYRIPMAGGSPVLLSHEYSLDPAWVANGSFVLYSAPDIGTTFSVKGVTADGAKVNLPALTLTRGSRHLVLLGDRNSVVVLRGEIQHKDLWLVDLQTGRQRQLIEFPPDFDVRDFDISPDGRDVVLERVQERSDVLLLDLPRS